MLLGARLGCPDEDGAKDDDGSPVGCELGPALGWSLGDAVLENMLDSFILGVVGAAVCLDGD